MTGSIAVRTKKNTLNGDGGAHSEMHHPELTLFSYPSRPAISDPSLSFHLSSLSPCPTFSPTSVARVPSHSAA